jgi:hypothetical protein
MNHHHLVFTDSGFAYANHDGVTAAPYVADVSEATLHGLMIEPAEHEVTVILPLWEDPETHAKRYAEAGFTVTGPRPDEPSWVHVKGSGHQIYLGFLRHLGRDPLLGGDLTPEDRLDRLVLWHRLIGTHYRYNPGVSTLAAMRGQTAGHPLWKVSQTAPGGGREPWQPPAQITDLRWRGATGRATGSGHHRWDMRSAYLNAAAQSYLPTGVLSPTGADPHPYGYYRIRANAPTDQIWLKYLNRKPDRQGCVWVGHELRALVATFNRGGHEVVDSWTTPTAARHLRPWAENIRDAITVQAIPAGVFKQGYAAAIGLLAVPRGSVYRPDWRHMIVDFVTASMLRRIARVAQLMEGLQPSKVDVDSIWYDHTDAEHIGEALGVGPLIGRMRYEGKQP